MQQPKKNGLSATAITAIILVNVLFGSCGLCGLIGAIIDRKEGKQQALNVIESPSSSPFLPSALPKSKTVIDIPKLIGQSPQSIEKVLGRPITTTPITRDLPNEKRTPGEFRDYKIDGLTKSISTENGVYLQEFHSSVRKVLESRKRFLYFVIFRRLFEQI